MTDEKVRVQTSDGDILEVDIDVAKQWGPINNMYEIYHTIDTREKPVHLELINTETLRKIIEWSIQHRQDAPSTAEGENQRRKYMNISDWDSKFFQIPQEMLFAIIMGANYLGMTVLLDMACKTVANIIQGKTPEQVRQAFNIPNDLPPPPSLNRVQ